MATSKTTTKSTTRPTQRTSTAKNSVPRAAVSNNKNTHAANAKDTTTHVRHGAFARPHSTTAISLTSEAEYDATMQRIEELMNIGSENVTFEQLQEIRQLSLKAQDYERERYPTPPLNTIGGLFEMKMYELKLKQKDLAEILEISNAKLSLIISGKQKPDAILLKKLHLDLNVDAHLILSVI